MMEIGVGFIGNFILKTYIKISTLHLETMS